MRSLPLIRASILVALAYTGNAYAGDAERPCLSEHALAYKAIYCAQSQILYHEDGQEKEGTLLTLDTGKDGTHYALLSPEGTWTTLRNTTLDTPERTLPCAFRSLYFSQNRFGAPDNYSASDFGIYQWHLANHTLKGSLIGRFPFTGAIYPIGTNCRGALRYENGMRSWQQAMALCKQTLKSAQAFKAKPDVTLLEFTRDAAGPYYLCKAESRQQENKTTSLAYYYRITMDRESIPDIILVRSGK